MDAEGKTARESVVLGVFFLMLVTTYASFSHIVTYIVEHSAGQFYSFEGELTLILNYIAYLLGLTRAPAIRNYKRQFQVAALCYSLNYALYLPQFDHLLGLIVSVVGALVAGYGASVLWISQGGYMVRLFMMNQIPKDKEGYYLGIQNGLVFTSSLIGAVIITFGLGIFGNQIYFLMLTCLGVLAFLLCTFLLDPLAQAEEEEDAESKAVTCRGFMNDVTKIAKFVPKVRNLVAAMVLDGLMLGFVASYLSHLIPESIRSPENVGIMLMLNGVGAVLGGYFSGYLSDKVHPAQLGVAGFTFIIISLLLTLLANYLTIETLYYPCLIGFLWGVCVYFLQGWIFVCCTKVFNGKIETYAIAKQFHTCAYILFQIYMIIVNNNINNVAYLIVLILLAVLALYSSAKLQQIDSGVKHEEIVEEISPPE